MFSKKAGTTLLSLFLIVSLAFGFVPRTSAATLQSQVIDEYKYSAATQQINVQGPGSYPEKPIMNNLDPVIISNQPTRPAPDVASISEKLYAGLSYTNNKTYSWSTGRGDSREDFFVDCRQPFSLSDDMLSNEYRLCGAPDDNLPVTLQNTTFLNTYYFIETYTRSNYPNLFDYSRNIQVKYQDPQTVQVNIGVTGFREDFSGIYKRTGAVMRILPGDQVTSYPAGAWCESFGGGDSETEICNDGAIYKDGQTLVFRWYSGWGEDRLALEGETPDYTGTCRSGEDTYDCGSVSGLKFSKISLSNLTPSNESVTRPLNSDIVYLSPTKCKTTYSSSFFTEKAEVYCLTYGLSADGRVGAAEYYQSDSSLGFGFIILGFALSFFAPYLLPETLSLDAALSTIGLTSLELNVLSTAISIATLTDPVIQAASGPSAYGTVENSNNLGVGNWAWSAGFDTATLTPVTPTSTVSLSCSYASSSPLIWGNGNCQSAAPLSYQNIAPGAAINVPALTTSSASYSGSVNFLCDASGAWQYVGETCNAPNGPGVYLEIY
ncbi:MAG: hypothetical protein HY432_03640 [Candidatus Liptonbacteria bacterium]|nr:hypothetical protein [Candidatus Liptonbacteria bacterium]